MSVAGMQKSNRATLFACFVPEMPLHSELNRDAGPPRPGASLPAAVRDDGLDVAVPRVWIHEAVRVELA